MTDMHNEIRDRLNEYFESRLLIRRLMEEGHTPEGGNYRLAGAAVHLTEACVEDIMLAMAFEVSTELERR